MVALIQAGGGSAKAATGIEDAIAVLDFGGFVDAFAQAFRGDREVGDRSVGLVGVGLVAPVDVGSEGVDRWAIVPGDRVEDHVEVGKFDVHAGDSLWGSRPIAKCYQDFGVSVDTIVGVETIRAYQNRKEVGLLNGLVLF